MSEQKALLDARDLQAPEWGMTRRQAYRVLELIGLRITPRRLVVPRVRLETWLEIGGDGRRD